jgi:hypothetical protein
VQVTAPNTAATHGSKRGTAPCLFRHLVVGPAALEWDLIPYAREHHLQARPRRAAPAAGPQPSQLERAARRRTHPASRARRTEVEALVAGADL